MTLSLRHQCSLNIVADTTKLPLIGRPLNNLISCLYFLHQTSYLCMIWLVYHTR